MHQRILTNGEKKQDYQYINIRRLKSFNIAILMQKLLLRTYFFKLWYSMLKRKRKFTKVQVSNVYPKELDELSDCAFFDRSRHYISLFFSWVALLKL